MIGYLIDGELTVIMGCRCFSLAEAEAHWGSDKYPNPRRAKDILAKLEYLKAVAFL